MEYKAVQRLIKITADANGQLPSQIHLLSAGHWHTPWHGAFEMTTLDLADMVIHFEQGVGQVSGSNKIPVNYGHDMGGKAAGWITKVYLDNNGTELWGSVEWTSEGTRALADQEYCYISPEWNPRAVPWEDPEQEGVFVDNVVTGAGLTNIPLFKKLQPIMASIDVGGGDKSTKQGGDMTLEQVIAKKPEELTEDERSFLTEHEAELTDEQRSTFGLVEAQDEDTSAQAEDDKGGEAAATEQQPATLEASAATGLTAAQIAQLQADAKAGREAQQELLRTRLTASVQAHINRGAIKTDQLTTAVELLMASNEAQRAKLTAFMAGLPENKIITAGELGDGGTGTSSAQDELAAKVAKVVADSAGKTTYAEALKTVMASDTDLRERVTAERSVTQKIK